MPKFETEIEVSLNEVWNKSSKDECDAFFYSTMEDVYLNNEDDRAEIRSLLEEYTEKAKTLKGGKK